MKSVDDKQGNISYFILRHDRPADIRAFETSPQHGFFLNNSDIEPLQYTIMAAGDNDDGGLGRIPYFSAPRTQFKRLLGTQQDDNTARITKSRITFQ